MYWKIIFALAMFAPAKLFACAACGSANPDAGPSPLTDGMNLGILTLLAVLAPVLTAFLVCLIHLIRKSEALEAAAQKNSPEPSKI